MALITEQFPNELRAKGFTEAQIQTVVEALAKDPGMIALATTRSMDRQDRTVRA